MRIGILTLPLHFNYGGILQAYALQTILERMGHQVVVIDKSRYRKVNWLKTAIGFPLACIKKYILKQKIDGLLGNYSYNKRIDDKRRISVFTQKFTDLHIHQLHINEFSDLNGKDFDAIIVGSDQIWRGKYSKSLLQSRTAPFLGFAESWTHLKRIAYAASFGTDEWEYTSQETQKCSRLIHLFDFVSVREQSGVATCQNRLNYDKAVHVVDPTMLLRIRDYEPLFINNSHPSKGNLMCYVLDETPELHKAIDNISKAKGLIPFFVGAKTNSKRLPLEQRIQPPLEQWLRGFYDAQLVITDSFHACVFAILFKKQFFVMGNQDRGQARFESLLSTFNLEMRLLNGESVSNSLLVEDIDYEKVHKKLDEISKKSFDLLDSWLK